MILDPGERWTGQIEIRNTADELEDATSVTLTITRPDGTTELAVVTHTSDGVYDAEYTPPVGVAGHFTGLWVATGDLASTEPVAFDVASFAPVVDIVTARDVLRVGQRAADQRLREVLYAATVRVEQIAGRALTRRTVVERRTGGKTALPLFSTPVQSVTSVVEDGVTLAATAYALETATGILYRTSGAWCSDPDSVVVTYTAGASSVDPDVREAVLVMAQYLIDAGRGGSNLPRRSGADAGADYIDGAGYQVRRAVEELVGGYRVPGIA